MRAGRRTFRAHSSSERLILGSHRILCGLYSEVWRNRGRLESWAEGNVMKFKSRKCKVLGLSYQCAIAPDGREDMDKVQPGAPVVPTDKSQ